MSKVNPKNGNDKVKAVRDTAKEVREIALQNIDLQLQQVSKLEEMEGKSAVLEAKGSQFSKDTVQLKRTLCWQNYRNGMMILSLLVVVGVVMSFIFS